MANSQWGITIKAEEIYNLTSPMAWQRQETGSDPLSEMWSSLASELVRVIHNTLFFSWKLDLL